MSRADEVKTKDRATGHWRGLLMEAGVPSAALTKRNCPCPLPGCGGTDRFRFIDTEGRGTWVCNRCGGGDGFDLMQAFTGASFSEVAARVDRALGAGQIRRDPVTERSAEEVRSSLRAVWGAGTAVEHGDLVDRYLSARRVNLRRYPSALATAQAIHDGAGGRRPAMLARVVGRDGHPVTIHRTFLHPDGTRKAEMESPRKMMTAPGEIPAGACVRLIPWTAGALGIAEGIESALAAARWWRVPVWAALNTSLLAKWEPPEGVRSVIVFADSDANYAGQSAAYRLAHRLAAGSSGVQVEVKCPARLGVDWQDLWRERLELQERTEAGRREREETRKAG